MDAVSFQHKTMGQGVQRVVVKRSLAEIPLFQSDSCFMCPQPKLLDISRSCSFSMNSDEHPLNLTWAEVSSHTRDFLDLFCNPCDEPF